MIIALLVKPGIYTHEDIVYYYVLHIKTYVNDVVHELSKTVVSVLIIPWNQLNSFQNMMMEMASDLIDVMYFQALVFLLNGNFYPSSSGFYYATSTELTEGIRVSQKNLRRCWKKIGFGKDL